MLFLALSVTHLLLAAVFKAAADTLAHHYSISVFAKFKNKNFWDMSKEAPVLKFTKYPLDAWHVSNSLMIYSFIGAGLFYPYKICCFWHFALDVAIAGTLFILVFNLFYNKIFKA